MGFHAIATIIIGSGIIIYWVFAVLTKQVPELQSEPWRAVFHIAAELLTAFLLIISGTLLLVGGQGAQDIFLISSGMLFYTLVASMGYFISKAIWPWVCLFTFLLVLNFLNIFSVV